MNGEHILVLDEGTTSTRAIVYGADGRVLHVAQQELTQHYPAPGRVEHDAAEIWDKTLACAREVIGKVGGADRIAALGITNQRETVVAWDRQTGEPITRAIVWQDRRTAEMCATLRDGGHEAMLQERTGLVVDPYFSGTKMRWVLDNVPEARALGERLALGTVESWLVWKLTGGLHVTDASNASRTQLMALDGADWDDDLLGLFGVPRSALGRIVDTAGTVGTCDPELLGAPIPISGLAGDQQAATIGQHCLKAGQTKATFGTGAFILTNMGETLPRSSHRLLGTVLCQQDGRRTYALEGSIFVAGSLIKWLRDELGVIRTAAESETLARAVADNGGVLFLPALAGLGAPHWQPDAKGVVTGLTQGTSRAHIVRAAMESMAHQCHDLQAAFAADGAAWTSLRIDGGMSANNWMAQDLADVLALPVERPADIETTALGAAMLAGVGVGLHASLEDAVAMGSASKRFAPDMDGAVRSGRIAMWEAGLKRHIDGVG
ncbi:glycerol kinase [Novosphingobium resinovorum]|uniref:FGGY family carbohydrate kinase n=1 Tax=Novosphingobium TaxID=165696 RepID=UPI001B3C75EC|nr:MULTISPECIES: glycerol kinase [Novosphingobium]MBF7010375.1 glycerol kinase [Novosphingobium sp. HR1a]WJM28377.1 glycerol kinase [Novosphingobium resinovorum]